jgi:hypothetical protein
MVSQYHASAVNADISDGGSGRNLAEAAAWRNDAVLRLLWGKEE